MRQVSDFIRVAFRFLTARNVANAEFPNSPALLALLWILFTAANVTNAVLLWGDHFASPGGVLHYGGSLILAALISAWVIGRRADAVRLGIAFMLLGLVIAIAWLGIRQLPLDQENQWLCSLILALWATIVVAAKLKKGWGQSRSHRGTVIACTIFSLIFVFTAETPMLEGYLWGLSPQAAKAEDSFDQYAPIDHETLWPAQPGLIEGATAKLKGRRAEGPRILILSVAAGGAQDIFAREAKASLAMLTSRFSGGGGGALLSNARADLGQVPLATNTNLSGIIGNAAAGFDASRDIMIVYLAAHGSRKAELDTNLPDFDRLHPISAQVLARSLDTAGIRRRIVIVSACYSGTWIAPLASPDTIVIAAAAADRTSFGCDDTREFTVFGDAFINGSLRQGRSLAEAFEDLKRRVNAEETRDGVARSLPQASVGANMREIWSASRSVSSTQ